MIPTAAGGSAPPEVETSSKGSSGPTTGAFARFGRACPALLLSSNPIAAEDRALPLPDLIPHHNFHQASQRYPPGRQDELDVSQIS